MKAGVCSLTGTVVILALLAGCSTDNAASELTGVPAVRRDSGSGVDVAIGGTGGAGGVSAAGGNTSSGGVTASGGTQANGGTVGTGGATDVGAGGVPAAGGSPAAGGTTAAGGAVGTGGVSGYHQLSNWLSPAANNPNQHGRAYFLANDQKDDNGIACTTCHGADLTGASGPSCASCHSGWRDCTFCHGTAPSQNNPPRGVSDETTTATLAVGRHTAHLSAGSSHVAFACATCHTVPATNDITHTVGYRPSADLSTTGSHGDVLLSGVAAAMTWTVSATTGTPVSARGTCVGACHSDGRGGVPATTPYWAGGTWTSGCTNCHGATGITGGSEHGHGFPGSACGDCHVGATSTSYTAGTHMNGTRDFLAQPGGAAAGTTLTVSGVSWTCSNSPCH